MYSGKNIGNGVVKIVDKIYFLIFIDLNFC